MRWSAHGRGEPVTLVVHGLGATPGEARIPASGLRGTRIVLTLPSHGQAADAPAGYWDYERVAADVAEVADEVEASRAVGVSLGAGALTRIVADQPRRFQRLALIQPAVLDHPRGAEQSRVFEDLAEAVAWARADGGVLLRQRVQAGVPSGVDVGDYVEQRATALMRLEEALRVLPTRSAVQDVRALSGVTAGVLVVAANADPQHPVEVARATAQAVPGARLEELPSAAPMLTHRSELRAMLRDFLG